MQKAMTSEDIDRANAQFWNELCGTTFARNLGITGHSLHSLELFDRAYLDFYPYLLERVGVSRMAGLKVLEVGLGYGTLGQKIIEAGADYTGLDIAAGPVRMMQNRLRLTGLSGTCVQGSALDIPLPSDSQDFVVSIGCFHHTGDLRRAFTETYRVLKSGGVAAVMVYNRFSYWQWLRFPRETFRALCGQIGIKTARRGTSEAQRRDYDMDSAGRAAPETVLSSIASLRRMLADFSSVTFHKENNIGILGLPRKALLPYLGRWMGLDIYIEARK